MTQHAFAQVDHLVIAAASLPQGVAWCEATLGITPAPGGVHPLMGTHNRLLRLSSGALSRTYLEIIAIDPDAADPGRARWFDLDNAAMQEAVSQSPRLIHFVAATSSADAAIRAVGKLGIDRGVLLAAERPTPTGLLRWQISVRPDGQRLMYGGLPTLIEWGEIHPAPSLPDDALSLHSLCMTLPRADDLRAAYAVIGLAGVSVSQGPPNLVATLSTPRGLVTLESKGI